MLPSILPSIRRTRTMVLAVVTALAGCGDDGAATSAGSETEGSTTTTSTSGPTGSTTASTTDSTTDSETAPTTAGSETSGSSDATTGSSDATQTGTGTSTGSDTDTDTGTDTDIEPGELPAPIDQSGIVYVGHFLSNDLRIYRVDTAMPTAVGTFDLGALTHDIALDNVNDRLITAHDVSREVRIYDIERPAAAGAPVAMPALRGAVTLATPPRFVRVDPYRNRIFVASDDTTGGTGMMRLHIIDAADPDAPVELGTPTSILATTSFDLDVARGLMFAFHGIPDTLGVYDVSSDAIVELPGSPIDLAALYPQENQNAFQARNLAVDMHHNRVYAGRAQAALSELIVIEYPSAVPGQGQSYADVASIALSIAVADGLDVDTPIADRPGILDAFTPLPSPTDDLVLMAASAWNGNSSTATLIGMHDDPLALAPGCEDHEGFGCFLRGYVASTPSSFLQTDGAACRDVVHSIVVATALGITEDSPGSVTFFSYDAATGVTAPLLSAAGTNLGAAELPVAAVCH